MKQRTAYILTCLLAVSSLATVSLLWQNGSLTLGALICISMMLLLSRGSLAETITFLTCAVAGACAEMVAIRSGAWTYHRTDLSGIPYWLPVLWGIAAIFIIRTHTLIGSLTKGSPRSGEERGLQ